ncbi:MAG: radical SAM/Cys-rich domain protein [Gammaproteobacteria bacterium]|nr:radical SAM/Cys-rich domain protein [Gammaproteobacteria bacterium]
MHNMIPRLRETKFPMLQRLKLKTLQINVGYRCNQACLHCHVNAGPKRKEMMDLDTAETVLDFLRRLSAQVLDITGGAPELNPHFRRLVTGTRAQNKHIIDRCNLTILEEPGQEDLGEFLAENQVEIIASMPCYLEENVDNQRGKGVFGSSIRGLQKLNALGFGKPDSGLLLNLVYNPLGPYLPPAQASLEDDYRRMLGERYEVQFNQLFTLANMPIARFGSILITRGEFDDYMNLLYSAHQQENVSDVMCRNLISVDYRGFVYDCDFNQMLGLALTTSQNPRPHLKDLMHLDLEGNLIVVADHCFGCTAGQGSSCGGALS